MQQKKIEQKNTTETKTTKNNNIYIIIRVQLYFQIISQNCVFDIVSD